MEILSNWVFWVVLASIVFVLALIGYLTESMKKTKKDNKEEKNDTKPIEEAVESQPTAPTVNEANNNDWMSMSKVDKPLEEVKVDTISDTLNVNNDVFNSQNNAETVTPVETVSDVTNIVEPSSVVTPVEPVSSEPAGLNVESHVDASTNVVEPITTDTTSVSEEVKPTQPVQDAPVESLNVSETDEKNNDIWNL